MRSITKSENLVAAALAGFVGSLIFIVTSNSIDQHFYHEGWLQLAREDLAGHTSVIGQRMVKTIALIFLSFMVGGYLAVERFMRKDEHHNKGAEVGGVKELQKMEAAGIKDTGNGIRIGDVQLSRRRESGHFRVIGLPGSGKTVLLNSMLVQVLRDRPADKVVIHDPKGDFTTWIKDDPIIYAPWDKRSARWLIGSDLDSQALAYEAAKSWVPQSNGDNAQFSDGAAQILAGILFNLQRTKPKVWGFSDLSRVISGSQEDICAFALAGWPAINGLISTDAKGALTKTTMSYLSTMLSPLSWVHQVAAAEAIATQTVSFREFAITEPPVRRVLIFKNDSRYAKSAETLFALALRVIAQNLCSPIVKERKGSGAGTWFFLDEFPQLAKSAGESVKMIQEVGRSKGARVVIAAQDLAQFTERYGKEEGEVMTRLQQTVIYGRVSNDSAHEISERSAKKTVYRRGLSMSETGSDSESLSQVDLPVIKPDDLTGLAITKTGPQFIVQIEAQPSLVVVPFESLPAVRPEAIDNEAFMTITSVTIPEDALPSAAPEVEADDDAMVFDDGFDFDEPADKGV